MKVATTTANIRPQNEVYLVGYIGEDRQKPAQGIHDDPLAVALLMELDNEKLLFLSIDVIMIPEDKARYIKKNIQTLFDIKYENIVISVIHSHSEPNGFNEVGALCRKDNEEYFHYATTCILESLKGLDEKLVEVEAEIGKTRVHGFYSNRNNIEKPFDDHATILRFLQGEHVVAAMFNFNCHSTVLGMKNMLITSDITGKVRSLIAEDIGVIPYTFTGASGDISNRQYRKGNDFNELERVGHGVANKIKEITDFQPLQLDRFSITEVDYEIAYDNTELYEEYREAIARAQECLQHPSITEDEWKLRTSEKAVLEEKLKVKDVHFHVPCKIIHMQALTIVTFPGELASCFGLELRARCTTPHFLLIGYADDYQGYFIEESEYGKCYETIATNTLKGESEKIIKKIGDLL